MAENDGHKTAVWWIRRDLRLTDNQALAAAMNHGPQIIPIFILDPALLASKYSGPKRLAFLFSGLEHLRAGIEARGGRLIIRQGHPRAELEQLLAESGATAVFAEADFSPYARRRDNHVQETVPLQLLPGLTVHPPDLIRKRDGDPYTVYTPFSKAWRSLPPPQKGDLLPAPAVLNVPGDLASEQIPEAAVLPAPLLFPAGEGEAQRRLAAFTSGITAAVYDYGATRNLPAQPGTSQLSPYLRFGMISRAQRGRGRLHGREAGSLNAAARESAETWLNELIWREFYINILYHFPHVRRAAFAPNMIALPGIMTRATFTRGKRAGPATRCRCGHAPAAGHRLDAQPGAHGHRFLPGQGSAH